MTDQLPEDAWKHPFIYTLTPEGDKPFVIFSYGADGRPGIALDKPTYWRSGLWFLNASLPR